MNGTKRRVLGGLTAAVFIAVSSFAPRAFAAPVIEKGDVVAVCGDSLTEQKVYSVYVEDYLLMCQPAPDVKTLGCGWGGSTARLVHDDGLPSAGSYDFKLTLRCKASSRMPVVS
jgi:hypothetical protein